MMTKDDWESLTGNRGWSALRQYLRDYRERVKEEWAQGKLGALSAEAMFKCQVLGDLADMDWDSIDNFYRPPDGSVIFKVTEKT